ncbi:MAG: AI-2E family transporter [SAR324 cluster bacterium]|nr:AI-2E family transporter [SAR324 cluster bacterium]
MEKKDIARIYFFGLLLLASLLMIIFARNFIHAVIFAFIISGILFPYNEKLKLKFKIPRVLSSILISLTFVVLLLIPFLLLVYKSFQEGVNVYAEVSAFLGDSHNRFKLSDVTNQILKGLNNYDIPISQEYLSGILGDLVIYVRDLVFSSLQYLVDNIFTFIANFCLMLLMMVGILSYGYRLKEFVMELFPIERHPEIQLLIEKFLSMNRATVLINSIFAVGQGSICGVAYFLAGIEVALLLALLSMFAAFIPLVGIMAISLPTAYFLYLIDQGTTAIVIILVTAVIYFVSENILKTAIIGRTTEINPLLLLLSIIGGVAQFGILGIFYGPLALIFFFTMVGIFNRQLTANE